MEAIAKGVGSLLTDSKYCDVEIRCGGQTLFKHRAIVCARCEVLEKECEESVKKTGKRIIEHSVFDPATYERFLQFLYTGDYTVDSAQLNIAKREASPECHANGNGAVYANGNKAAATLPHLRHVSPKVNGYHDSTKYAPATNNMEAHVLVYAIACHYELRELKGIALKKFKDAKQTPLFVTFLALVKMVYGLTESADDPLRKEVLRTLPNDYRLSLASDHAKNVLAKDLELHQLAADVTQALAKQFAKKAEKEESDREAQSMASKLLLSDLERANDALLKSSARIEALETDVEKLQGENSSLKTAYDRIKIDNNSFKDAIVESTSTKSKLEAKLLEVKKSADKSVDNIGKIKAELHQKQEQLKFSHEQTLAVQEQLKTETARADKNLALYKEKHSSAGTKTANEWKKAHDAEYSRAEKAFKVIKSIVFLVNRTPECECCGERLNFRLIPDDRTIPPVSPFNSMLRCCNCDEDTYGAYVAP